ncbi:MAG: ABC transporter ATP-binding protein [Verrucomicrobia bacterium]|nr:ABC transporter ATP-binding protein [Verrucomicrobiota bacterium]
MSKPAKLPFPQLMRAFWSPYLRLLGYMTPYRKRFFLGIAFGVLAGIVSGSLTLVILKAGESIGVKIDKSQLMPGAIPTAGPGIGGVIGMSLLIPLVMVLRGIFSYLNVYYLAWVSLRVLRDIRTQLFAHLMSQSLDFFNREKTGKLMSRVMSDTRVTQNALTSISGDIIKDPIAVMTQIGVLVAIDWKFSLTTLVLFPLCIIPVVVFGRKVRSAGKAEERESAQMSIILQETFAGVRVIKSFARESYQTEQFAKSSDTQCQNSLRVRRSSDIVQPLIESVSAFGVVLAMVYVYYYDISFIKFAALCGGIFMLYQPVKNLSRLPMLMQKCMVSAVNVFELMETKPSIVDRPGAIVLGRSEGRIDFEKVSFDYGSDKAAVQDVTLQIEPGKKYALVGASGAGKSTILSLIMRFYDPQKGIVRIDGHDLRDVAQHSLRETVGMVTQETFLFHDTIYENIRYGRLDATREEIIAAAQSAFAHDFILAQPDGYETIVGDKGCMLSGGQQQRLAIARALLKNAPFLLLDEATSALDSESERMVQAALERLAEGRTVVAIAHRLSTILNSDCIVVMDHGRIVATGRHDELLQKSDLYRSLYELQFHHHDSLNSEPLPA